ncbi:MAG: TIGR00153 family protein [Nitrospinae bacterium]|nr:TIGR00153 family protein [Nitrospinota bacterium]MZH04971.1 TIGR00153 family protein [Nitrospinota bacterium]MZH13571.1 TIGR00153 family protein [Nitrospinota bacterium]
MRSILSMFSKSPFKPLGSHMDKVRACVDQIDPMFKALHRGDYDEVGKISELIMKMEHEADMIKDDIRTHMKQTVFLPVDKKDFMHLLSAQDDIADAVEDLAVLLRIKNLSAPESIHDSLQELVEHVIKTAYAGCDLILELEALLESSFGGAEAEKVEKATQVLGTLEWEADRKQFQLAQKLFSLGNQIDAADLLLWNEVIKKLGAVADKTEQIGKTLRIFLSQ